MKPRERKPQRVIDPLTGERRREIYIRQNRVPFADLAAQPEALTARQQRRMRKATSKAKVAAERSVAS